MHLCDVCGNKCFKTLYGCSVTFCKDDIRCCMNCHQIYRKYVLIKTSQNILNYIIMRQITC